MIGVAMGARVIAVDIKPEALALARSLGVVHALDASALPISPARSTT